MRRSLAIEREEADAMHASVADYSIIIANVPVDVTHVEISQHFLECYGVKPTSIVIAHDFGNMWAMSAKQHDARCEMHRIDDTLGGLAYLARQEATNPTGWSTSSTDGEGSGTTQSEEQELFRLGLSTLRDGNRRLAVDSIRLHRDLAHRTKHLQHEIISDQLEGRPTDVFVTFSSKFDAKRVLEVRPKGVCFISRLTIVYAPISILVQLVLPCSQCQYRRKLAAASHLERGDIGFSQHCADSGDPLF